MSISKTRQKLVDVARQLFAKNGIANTTMNDIAVASGKGRRTLYTYFSRKEDVYYAVIESELERLSDKLDEVATSKIRPQDKIIELIYTHLNMPLVALADLREMGEKDDRYTALADIVDAHKGLWCPEAEEYLLAHFEQE